MDSAHIPDEAGRSVLTLSAHGFDVEIDPKKGGRINRAVYHGQPLFEPHSRPDDPSPLDGGCFPLVPFSNRVRHGRFEFDGHAYQLDRNWTGDGHAIHGEGWLQPWRVMSMQDNAATLKLNGTPWWPWAYDCLQTIELAPGEMTLTLTLRNLSDRPMPAGLGFHPYFPRTGRTHLRFDAAGVRPPIGKRVSDTEPLSAATDFGDGRQVSGLSLDHCYFGWTGTADISQPDHGLHIEVSTNRTPGYCVIFVPDDQGFFCFEPVSHLTGAIAMADVTDNGLVRLRPGETTEFAARFAVSQPR